MNVLSLVIADQLLSQYSDDTKFSIEEVVNVVISEHKVTLPIREESNLTITLYGDLNSISSDELGKDYNSLEEYINNWQQITGRNISVYDLFLFNTRTGEMRNNISRHLTKITTSSGEVFIKKPERSTLPGDRRESAANLLHEIYIRTLPEAQGQISQADLDCYMTQAWEVWTKNS
jgi:hypothetical protein